MSRRRRSRPLPVAQPTPRPEESSEADAAVVALQAECAKLAEEELPLRVAYERFLDLVHRVVPFAHGTLYVAEWTSGKLSPVAVRGNRVELADRIRFARGRGLSAWVAQEGRAVVIPDPAAREKRTAFADETLRAFLAFPLVQQGVVSGVVALTRTDSTFAEDEFDRLAQLAAPLARTLSTMRRETQMRELISLDAETGLSSDHHFLARLEEELQRAAEFALVLLELRMSPGAERAPLVQRFTRRLREVIRSCDLVAHLGEGRFGVLLAGVNRETAGAIVDRFAEIVARELRPASEAALRLRVGLATGTELQSSPSALLQHAAAVMADIA
ncbi:MAG TPA: GAF domain-containing protein [bacterium]|nr:GAF domain-containing protein [bacterium]